MLYQKYYLCFLLSLPKGDSANSERWEESVFFCTKSDDRSPKMVLELIFVSFCHSGRGEKSISFRYKMQIQYKGLFQNINWKLLSLRETIS